MSFSKTGFLRFKRELPFSPVQKTGQRKTNASQQKRGHHEVWFGSLPDGLPFFDRLCGFLFQRPLFVLNCRGQPFEGQPGFSWPGKSSYSLIANTRSQRSRGSQSFELHKTPFGTMLYRQAGYVNGDLATR